MIWTLMALMLMLGAILLTAGWGLEALTRAWPIWESPQTSLIKHLTCKEKLLTDFVLAWSFSSLAIQLYATYEDLSNSNSIRSLDSYVYVVNLSYAILLLSYAFYSRLKLLIHSHIYALFEKFNTQPISAGGLLVLFRCWRLSTWLRTLVLIFSLCLLSLPWVFPELNPTIVILVILNGIGGLLVSIILVVTNSAPCDPATPSNATRDSVILSGSLPQTLRRYGARLLLWGIGLPVFPLLLMQTIVQQALIKRHARLGYLLDWRELTHPEKDNLSDLIDNSRCVYGNNLSHPQDGSRLIDIVPWKHILLAHASHGHVVSSSTLQQIIDDEMQILKHQSLSTIVGGTQQRWVYATYLMTVLLLIIGLLWFIITIQLPRYNKLLQDFEIDLPYSVLSPFALTPIHVACGLCFSLVIYIWLLRQLYLQQLDGWHRVFESWLSRWGKYVRAGDLLRAVSVTIARNQELSVQFDSWSQLAKLPRGTRRGIRHLAEQIKIGNSLWDVMAQHGWIFHQHAVALNHCSDSADVQQMLNMISAEIENAWEYTIHATMDMFLMCSLAVFCSLSAWIAYGLYSPLMSIVYRLIETTMPH